MSEKEKKTLVNLKVDNPTDKLAFFIHILLTKSSNGEEVLPIFWNDNYFSLLPGEKKELKATFAEKDLNGTTRLLKWKVGTYKTTDSDNYLKIINLITIRTKEPEKLSI